MRKSQKKGQAAGRQREETRVVVPTMLIDSDYSTKSQTQILISEFGPQAAFIPIHIWGQLMRKKSAKMTRLEVESCFVSVGITKEIFKKVIDLMLSKEVSYLQEDDGYISSTRVTVEHARYNRMCQRNQQNRNGGGKSPTVDDSSTTGRPLVDHSSTTGEPLVNDSSTVGRPLEHQWPDLDLDPDIDPDPDLNKKSQPPEIAEQPNLTQLVFTDAAVQAGPVAMNRISYEQFACSNGRDVANRALRLCVGHYFAHQNLEDFQTIKRQAKDVTGWMMKWALSKALEQVDAEKSRRKPNAPSKPAPGKPVLVQAPRPEPAMSPADTASIAAVNAQLAAGKRATDIVAERLRASKKIKSEPTESATEVCENLVNSGAA